MVESSTVFSCSRDFTESTLRSRFLAQAAAENDRLQIPPDALRRRQRIYCTRTPAPDHHGSALLFAFTIIERNQNGTVGAIDTAEHAGRAPNIQSTTSIPSPFILASAERKVLEHASQCSTQRWKPSAWCLSAPQDRPSQITDSFRGSYENSQAREARPDRRCLHRS